MGPRHGNTFSGKRLPLSMLIRACWMLCACTALVLTGCGDRGGGEGNMTSRAQEHAPMLPGAGVDKRQDMSGPLAQSVDMLRNPVGLPASGVLLPPVMHSAD